MNFKEVTNRAQFGEFIDAQGYKIALEIGVREGNNSKHMLETSKLKELYCIDPWTVNKVRGMTRNHNGNEIIGKAITQLDPYGTRVILIRAKSQDVSHLFYDGFFDFIHIDGAHHYQWIKQDIKLYWNKLCVGGCFTGHDYSKKPKHLGSVERAVDEFVAEKNLDLHITSDKNYKCWMVMK